MSFQYAIALTGGIATGKSTVASLLALNGMRVIDADTIAHTVLENSKEWVAETFGEIYIGQKGVERKKLGQLIFNDKEKKQLLESYLHPKIKKLIEQESQKQDALGFAYLIDIPLFFENNNYPIKKSVVVYTPKTTQLDRFLKRDNFTKEDALKRVASQMDIEQKKQKATWVIDNSKNLKHLQNEVEQFVTKIKQEYRCKW